MGKGSQIPSCKGFINCTHLASAASFLGSLNDVFRHLKAQVKGQFPEDFPDTHQLKAMSVLGALGPGVQGWTESPQSLTQRGASVRPFPAGNPKAQGLSQASGM